MIEWLADRVITNYALAFGSILIFFALVLAHESGHYIAARIARVRIEKFVIGLGKEVWWHKDRRGTRWSLNLLPLYGYVGLARKPHSERREDSFCAQPLWRKCLVVAAGPLASFLFAFLLLFTFYLTIGRPVMISKTIPAISFIQDNAATDAASSLSMDESGSAESIFLPLPLKTSIRWASYDTVRLFPALVAWSRNIWSTTKYRIRPPVAPSADNAPVKYNFYIYVYITAVMSLALGLVTLLPLPRFDGYYLLQFGVEALVGAEYAERTNVYVSGFLSFALLGWLLASNVTAAVAGY